MTNPEISPEPLTPPECDLRDFAYMPLDVVRLRDSDIAAASDAEVFRAAVLAWCAAWHQIPAASLPDDDMAIARLVGMGRDVKGWRKLRAADALHGFVKCSDGRLYHPVVAEKAVTAWQAKQSQRDRTEKARLARLSQRKNNEHKSSVTDNVTHSVVGTTEPSKGEVRDREVKTFSLHSNVAATPHQKSFISIPSNLYQKNGEEIPILDVEVEDYETTYPSVDVRQKLREIRRWSIDNPSKRKTKSGMKKFVNSWLAREQDKGNGKSIVNGNKVKNQSFLEGIALGIAEAEGGSVRGRKPGGGDQPEGGTFALEPPRRS